MIIFNLLVSLVTVAKAPSAWRHRGNPLIATFWLALASLNISMIVNQPSLYDALGELTGLSNIASLLSYGLGVAAAFWLQAFLMLSSQPVDAAARVRRRGRLVLALLVAMTICYGFGPLQDVNTHADTHVPADSLGDLGLRLLLATWVLWSMPAVAGLCIRFARRSTSPVLRAGLWCAAAGTVPILVRIFLEYGPYAIASWGHTTQSALEGRVILWLNIGTLVGLVMIAIGFTAPGLARGWATLSRSARSLLAYLRLGRLWRITRSVSPSLAWLPPGPPLLRRFVLFGIDGRLYRRVIEIRDGLLTLAPYRDAELAEAAQARARHLGLDELEAGAYRDAGALPAALRAHRDGVRPERVDGVAPVVIESLELEVAYLLLVARFLGSGAPEAPAVSAGFVRR